MPLNTCACVSVCQCVRQTNTQSGRQIERGDREDYIHIFKKTHKKRGRKGPQTERREGDGQADKGGVGEGNMQGRWGKRTWYEHIRDFPLPSTRPSAQGSATNLYYVHKYHRGISSSRIKYAHHQFIFHLTVQGHRYLPSWISRSQALQIHFSHKTIPDRASRI